MTSSTMPVAERLDWHPVHQATARLHHALLSSASPDPAEIWDNRTLRFNPAPAGVAEGPTAVTFPTSLATLLGLLSSGDRDISAQPPITRALDGDGPSASGEDAPEGDTALLATAQDQLQRLVQDFYQRQRQASLLVACSVVTAFVLTFSGLALLFSLVGPETVDRRGDASPENGISVARTAPRAAIEMARVEPVRQHVSRLAAPTAQVIHVTPGRALALAPLLPLGSARYFLLRGFPKETELSAGRRTGPTTWMVKNEDASSLTLTVRDGASGDYPLDIYRLSTGNGPQARLRLVLRVANAPPAPAAAPQRTTVAMIEADALRQRAQRLLGEGDIATARRLLTQAAERGNGRAAYELALTYDREVLAKAGIQHIDSDAGIARGWYEFAAQDGHAQAGQRLQMLARRRAAS